MLPVPNHHLLRLLVLEDIAHVVAKAAEGVGFLRAGEHAYRLAKAYPNCGMNASELVNEIIGAAASAGVAVEMSQPYPQSAEAGLQPRA